MSVLTARTRAPSPAPQQVALGVYLVTLGRGVAGSNVYLVRSDSTWTLVDTAWGSSAAPGHTPGHVAYLRRSDGVLIAGDAALTVDLNSVGGVLLGRQRVAGPPRYTTWDWRAARRSVGALADLEPRVLLPGHGRPLTLTRDAAGGCRNPRPLQAEPPQQ